MPNKATTPSSKTRKSASTKTAASRPSKLTVEQQQHQNALKAIREQPAFAGARKTWEELSSQVESLRDKRQALGDEAREMDRARTRAATAQNYLEAQSCKEKYEAIKKQIEDISTELAPLTELYEAAVARHSELFLADVTADFNRPQSVTVTLVRVIDPRTGDYDVASYLESDDIVQLCVAEQHFESEGYHISSWAEQRGFVVRKAESIVEM